MIAALLVLLCLLPAAPAGAQVTGEPEEPDIVLPEVILRIEDFSVESVEGALPAEEEALPPARELPLPEREELAVAEPVAPLELGPSSGPVPAGAPERTLSAQAEFGAGSMNHVYGSLGLFGVGEDPRFRLRFLHETLDGMGAEAPGSGFDFRQDSLEGGLKIGLGPVQLEASGELDEEERGLQGQIGPGTAVARLVRRGGLDAEVLWPLAEHWSLAGKLDSGFFTQLLTGTSPDSFTELTISPGLTLQMRYPRFQLALAGSWAARGYPVASREAAQRAAARLELGWDLSDDWRLEASGGWHWGTLTGHLLPFSVSLSGAPHPSFSLQASGGYRVTELDSAALAAAFPYSALPAVIRDDHGWYAEAGAAFTLRQAFSLQAATRLSWPTWAPEASTALEPSGLLAAPVQGDSFRWEVEASLAWTPARQNSLRASWRMQLAEHPAYTPTTEIGAEAEAATRSGRWSGRGSLSFRLGYAPAPPEFTLWPLLDLSAYFQASEAIRITAEGEDLLQPFIDGPRPGWDPFVEPGIRGTLKIQINL